MLFLQPFMQRHLAVRLSYLGVCGILALSVQDLLFLSWLVVVLLLVTRLGSEAHSLRYAKRMALLPVILMLTNPLFNHRGQTVLFVIATRRFTLESFQMGYAHALRLYVLLLLFNLFHRWVSHQEFLRVTGRFMPQLALILAMALTFAPRLAQQAEEVRLAQRSVIGEEPSGRLRLRFLGERLLTLLAWALEDGLHMAKRLSSRGYGLHPVPTRAWSYPFLTLDAILEGMFLVCAAFGLTCLFTLSPVTFYPTYQGWQSATGGMLSGCWFAWSVFLVQPIVFSMIIRRWRQGRRERAVHIP